LLRCCTATVTGHLYILRCPRHDWPMEALSVRCHKRALSNSALQQQLTSARPSAKAMPQNWHMREQHCCSCCPLCTYANTAHLPIRQRRGCTTHAIQGNRNLTQSALETKEKQIWTRMPSFPWTGATPKHPWHLLKACTEAASSHAKASSTQAAAEDAEDAANFKGNLASDSNLSNKPSCLKMRAGGLSSHQTHQHPPQPSSSSLS